MRPTRHIKRQKGKAVTSDGTTEESNDSSSKTDSDDGNDGDDTGGGTASLAAQDTPHEQPLPSRLTNSHIAPRIKITAARHRQEFPHIRRILRLIVLTLLTGLMISLSLAHINITSQTFRVSRLPGGFMSGLSLNFITCVTRTGKALLNGPTSHGRNTRPTFFEPKVLCSCPRTSIMQCRMRSQCSGR
jgi:hypothetical protein